MEMVTHSGLTGIAILVLAALMCGMAMERMKQPAFVGYILAGLLLGPTALGLVEDRKQIDIIAELGVLMLLFVIGMELSIRLFLRLWKFVLLATGLQILAAGGITLLLSNVFGWGLGMAVLLGFVVALSSTAIGIKMLEETGELKTRTGLLSVGILIAQDLAFVPMLLVLGVISVGEADYRGLLVLLGSVLMLGWLMWYLAKGGSIQIPFLKNIVQNMDLTPLGALAFCFGAAAVSGVLGLSPAYGAFLAGLVLGNSGERPTFIGSIRPIQSIFMMVFFVSIGLLIDLQFIWANIGTVLVLLFLVTIFKTAMNTTIVRMLGQSWRQAFLVSVMLAQIGEFSFLLSKTGLETGIIGGDTMRLVMAVTVLSLAISPLWVVTARRIHNLTANVTTLGDLLTSVYAQEANIAASATNKIRPQIALSARRVKNTLRNIRARERFRRLALFVRMLAAWLPLYSSATSANDHPVIGEDAKGGGDKSA